MEGFPLLRSVREWDKNDGDATLMLGVDRQYDLVYSSHCIEHLDRPIEAVRRWWELVAVGGHLVVVAPDEELYERFEWPSTKNLDHRFSFTTITRNTPPRMPNGVRMQLLAEQCAGGRLISLVRLEDNFYPKVPRDQTALGTCECGIELVIRKER